MLNRILVAYDGSVRARSAVEMAVMLLAGRPWTVTLLTVVEPHTNVDVTLGGIEPNSRRSTEAASVAQEAQKMLEEVAAKLVDLGCTVETAVELGAPVDRILETAKRGQYDLIVLGEKSRSGLAEFFLGSTAYAISRRAHCSVLLVK